MVLLFWCLLGWCTPIFSRKHLLNELLAFLLYHVKVRLHGPIHSRIPFNHGFPLLQIDMGGRSTTQGRPIFLLSRSHFIVDAIVLRVKVTNFQASSSDTPPYFTAFVASCPNDVTFQHHQNCRLR